MGEGLTTRRVINADAAPPRSYPFSADTVSGPNGFVACGSKVGKLQTSVIKHRLPVVRMEKNSAALVNRSHWAHKSTVECWKPFLCQVSCNEPMSTHADAARNRPVFPRLRLRSVPLRQVDDRTGAGRSDHVGGALLTVGASGPDSSERIRLGEPSALPRVT